MKLSKILHKIFPFYNQKAKNQEHGKPEFIIHDKDDDYIKDRLGRFIIFFDKERAIVRRRERILQYTIIILGSLIPIVNLVGIQTFASNILSAIFGASIAIITAILQLEKYHERWLSFKMISTKLSNEYYFWKNKSGDYSLKEEESVKLKLPVLVKRCEDIILSEAVEYVNLFRATKPEEGSSSSSPQPPPPSSSSPQPPPPSSSSPQPPPPSSSSPQPPPPSSSSPQPPPSSSAP